MPFFRQGPPNFLVYDQSGRAVFQSAAAAFGVWAFQGDKLFFLAPSQEHGIAGDLHSWDPTTGETPLARNLSDYFWPALAPDGHRLLFNSYDSAGLPHLWSVDPDTGAVRQLATSISALPVVVGNNVVWSTEEKPCDCGPGGNSAHDAI